VSEKPAAGQIFGILREHDGGAKTADLARKYGVSEATLYNWKAKFGGMDVSDAKRLKQLEDHFKMHKKDHHSRRGLLSMVARRRRLLKYLKSRNPERYKTLILSLGIRR